MYKKSMLRKVILYIASSLDGYIAGNNDDLSFLSLVQTEGEDYGYAEFYKTVDMVIMGRKTFDWVAKKISGLPHPDKKTYIMTRTKRQNIGNTEFYTGDLKELILILKNQKGKNIFCDGGSEIVNELLQNNLLDEMIISIIPVLLGNGTRLFKDSRTLQNVNHLNTKSFPSGLVQVHYSISENHNPTG